MTTVEADAPLVPPAQAGRWTAQWKELYAEVITTGLCTGCAGCVVTCPHDVIGYEHEEGKYIPFHLEEELGLDNCIHGEKGCTTCTRACPRFRAWEPAADMHLFGRVREPDEMAGMWRQLFLTRASDDMVHKMGQDGGLVSAMLIWLREHDYIDAALVSGVEDDDAWKAKPAVVSTKEEILATAGSRYTYCANPLALPEAKEKGLRAAGARRHGLPDVVAADDVGSQGRQGVQAVPVQHRAAVLEDVRRRHLPRAVRGQVRPEEAGHGEDEHQGRLPDLDEGRLVPRDRPQGVPRLDRVRAARPAPTSPPSTPTSSTGGIGEDNDWTLTIVRTELGEEVINRMIADGSIIARPAQTDEKAMRLLRLLSIVSRRRWPEFADRAPAIGVPPPKVKKPAARTPRRLSRPLQPTSTPTDVCVGISADRSAEILTQTMSRRAGSAYFRQDFEVGFELVEFGVRRGLGGRVAVRRIGADLLELVLADGVDLGEHAVALLVGLGQRVDQVLGDASGRSAAIGRPTRRGWPPSTGQRRGASDDQTRGSQRRHDSGRIRRCPCGGWACPHDLT